MSADEHERLFDADPFLIPRSQAGYDDIAHILRHLVEIGDGLDCLAHCPFVEDIEVAEYMDMLDVTDRLIGTWTRALGPLFDPDVFLASLEDDGDGHIECDPED